LRRVLGAAEAPAALGQAALAPLLASYTGALLGNTVVPTWEAGRGHLSYLFASSASLAAGGAAMVTTPVAETRPARMLAAAGVVGDVVAMRRMKASMHPLEAEPLETGRAGRLLTWAERLAVAGGIGAVLGGRNRYLAAAGGAALLASSALTRFGVLYAGLESVEDPRRVVEPQKQRLAARRAAGVTDDSITTAGCPCTTAAGRFDTTIVGRPGGAQRTSIPAPSTVCPRTGGPGTSPIASSPPEVCASASSSRSSSVTSDEVRRCARTHSRLRRVPPETKPSRRASAAPSTSGTAARSRTIPTLEARPILNRCPNRPKPVTSVAALAPAASAAREASRFRA